MKHRELSSSLLHVIALAVAVTFLILAKADSVDAYGPNCTAAAGACASQCGTNVSWEVLYTWYNPYCDFNPVTQQWIPCWEDEYNVTFGSGVEYFECQEVNPEDAICMCAY